MYSRMEKYHGRRAQRFSIRKYSFGAASVLLGTALLLGANAVKADETSTASAKTPEVTNSDKQKSDSGSTTPVVEELPELKIDAVKADEKSEVKADEKPEVKEDAKTEAKPVAKPVAEKEVTDKAATEKSDKEQADKKEADKEKTNKETSEKAATEKAQDDVKTVLTQLTSEADVMATVASNFSDKEVKDEASKQKLSAAIATVKLEAVASKGLLSSDASKDQMVAQVNRLSAAIEAVYTEMKRAGHAGKVESVLAATASKITGKDVFKDGETVKAVTNAYVDMNADNTAPTGWGFDTTISTSTLKAGSITKIELTNLAELGAGLAVNTLIRATDGTVVGKVKSIDYKTTTGNSNNKKIPYWAQRDKKRGDEVLTYAERFAEQPAVANETGTYTYNIEWNDKVKDYPNVSFGASNLSGEGYLAPQISKDTPYTATIKIDGRTVLEHTYTRKGQQPSYQKQGTSASLSENNGLKYLNNEQISRSDSIVLKTDSDIRYGVGSKFTIKLPNADFTEFKELEGSSNFVNGLNTASTINPNKGDSITYVPTSRWANVKANENNVWILNDGRDTGFTLTPRLISPTELELTVTEGAIQEGSTVSMALQALGIEKVIKDKTLTSQYSNITYENGLIKEGYVGNDKTAATLTVSGGESVNGEKEDVITTVPNGWKVIGDGKVQGEPPTGAVVRTFKDLVTGEVIGFEPTRYTGNIPLSEDGSKDYTNVLGNKYDVSNDPVDLVKEVNGEEYILADLPPENVKGTLSVTKTRARDLYSEEELNAKGINGSAFVTPAQYDYVKKTKVEEVNRTIKFVYADDVKDLAGTEVFPSQKQTVSYTGSIKLTAEGKAVINSNDRPVYINWKGTDGQSTDLPELEVPQKEGYIASVEKVPVQATTATDEDYEYVVKYTAIQKAKTTFVDEKGNAIPGVAEITEQGGSETPLTKEADVKAKIKELENKGYELVSNTYPEGGKFDTDKDTDQEFKVTLKQKEVTVTPDQPKTPGTPVDPNNPDGPKYPAGLEEKDLNKTVTRTITYVYEDGTPVLNEDGTPKTVTQEAKFTREAKVNLVTGEVTYGDWTPAQDLAEVKSPVVKGYLADKASVPVVTVTGDSKDTTEVVTYKPIGSWIPNIPGQPTNPIKYPNNPDDPTKPGKPTETLPYVEGFTPKDKDGNPLKPVDPTDPTKGYVVPDLPTDPSQDTPINYVKDTQKAKTTFVDEKGNPIPGVDAITEEGDSDTPLTKEADVKAKIKELENKGYELVSNTYPEGGKFDKDKDTDQEFKVTLKAKEVTVTPDQPKTPGTPVDPNNPDGPKYPAGLEEKDLNKTVTRTITYVYEDGTPVLNEDGTPKTVTQEAKFTREAKVNLVTGEVTYGDWTPAQDLAEVKSPVVKGYLADKASVPTTKVTADSKDATEVVTYKPIGSWIPNIPGQPTTPIKYPNDPADPTKPGQPTEVLPYVPGFTPEDKDGNPLKPVDPTDPTKGYVVPNIPTDPSQDTVINYVANKAKLVVKYVDEKGKDLIPSETTEGKVGDEYTTTGKVIPGHLLVRVEGEAKGKIGKDGSTVTYVYKPIGSWIPNIPGQPTTPIKYPNDPADPTKPGKPTDVLPYVPGFTPEDKDGNPLKPVDPTDPTKGYVVPNIPTDPSQDTVINYVANKAKLVVKYVDEKGKDLIPSETTEGKVGDEYTTTGKVIPGHLLVRVDGDAKGKIGTDGSTVTYVYKPIGSWIPNIPGQPTSPIKYPNDPADPTKPGKPTDVLPYVPGFTPEDKDGNPLKPVDPTDPTKGYVVPNIPTDPSQDTVINYVANKAKLVVKYVDEKGKDLIPSETTEGKVGDEYATSGKVIKGYVLVRVDGEAKGKIGKDGSTVTYIYKPLGSWVPNIPGQPTDPIKYPNDPTDPTKPGKDKPVLPYVPGYTPKDKDGNPLKPVDPNDPTKGYEVPNVPTNPGEDTPINYVANKANLVVKYVDEKGKDLLPAETTEGKVGDEYATSGKVIKGYVLVRVDGEAKGKIGKDGSTVTYVYKPLGSWVPNIPGQPTDPIKYPNDPTDPTKPGKEKPVLPYVPGYTPKDKDGNPLKPVDPNDPTKGYEVPNVPTNPGEDTPINYVPNPREVEKPAKPAQPSKQETPKYVEGQKELPNTGTEANASLAALGLLGALGGFGLLARKKKED
ncbi:MucBP domain-containing protein [Streptococcus sp. SM3]|nr:MucBP domain-containing protein [Streptococcus sp. SM3]